MPKDFEVLRRHMLAEISAATVHTSGLIGKAALDERVMTAMGKVPRHEFVPIATGNYEPQSGGRVACCTVCDFCNDRNYFKAGHSAGRIFC
jgi:hypothetical protein